MQSADKNAGKNQFINFWRRIG